MNDSDILSIDVPLLNVRVDPMTATDVCEWVVARPGKAFIANHNLHSVYLYHTNPQLAEIYDKADKVVIDGAPVLALARRVRRSLGPRHRIGSTDWIPQLADQAAGMRLAIYGASPASNAACVEALRDGFGKSGWVVDGLDGYQPSSNVIEWLKEFKPDLVLVGLGMPRQEMFLHAHWDQLPHAVYANVGGAIDYLGGTTRLAPRWMGALGVEWAWRLLHSPRRLAGRYLIEPFRLGVILIRRHVSSGSTGPLDGSAR